MMQYSDVISRFVVEPFESATLRAVVKTSALRQAGLVMRKAGIGMAARGKKDRCRYARDKENFVLVVDAGNAVLAGEL